MCGLQVLDLQGLFDGSFFGRKNALPKTLRGKPNSLHHECSFLESAIFPSGLSDQNLTVVDMIHKKIDIDIDIED